jgi:hypothetical protein
LFTQVKYYTTIPMPKVLAWSANATNPVGTEYIVLEKAPGRQLFRVWGDMNPLERYALIQHRVRLESQLAALTFPCSGALYKRDFAQGRTKTLGNNTRFLPLHTSLDPLSQFCIGPAFNKTWLDSCARVTAEVEALTGPCTTHVDLYPLAHAFFLPAHDQFGSHDVFKAPLMIFLVDS